jgi:hypothetical protein
MSHPEGERAGVATHKVDAVVAALIFFIGVVVASSSLELGASWAEDGPESGYFPFYIGLILCISGLGVFYQAVFGKEKNTEVFVDKESFIRVLQVLIPSIVYVAALQLIGIYVASAVFIALFMVLLGKFSWLKSAIIGIAINALFFMMFEVWFKVPLHKGTFDPLAFLGY